MSQVWAWEWLVHPRAQEQHAHDSMGSPDLYIVAQSKGGRFCWGRWEECGSRMVFVISYLNFLICQDNEGEEWLCC